MDRWISHSFMSNPGDHIQHLTALPSQIDDLLKVVGGLLIHGEWLLDYGVDESQIGAVSRETLPVAARLDQILARDSRALHIPRIPEERSVSTCRDFALMLCSFLRSSGRPARLRCGFASYFGVTWEDHWICEYWHAKAGAWRLADPQIDPIFVTKYDPGFDPADVPRECFLTAGEAWTAYRTGKANPSQFGHGNTTGFWFIKVNVVRDHYVLNNRETSAWDSWRLAPISKRLVSEREMDSLDRLAEDPEQPLYNLTPDWTA